MTILIRACKAFLNFIFFFFKLLPVSDKITFLSRQSDEVPVDMAMLGEELKRQAPEYQMVFLCRTIPAGIKGKLSYSCHMFRQMYHIATSRIVIIDSYCMGVSLLHQRESLLVVQMWHALGALKKFGYSILGTGEGRSRSVSEVMNMHYHYDMIISSSSLCAPHFAEAFGYDEDHVQVASLPRVDLLTDDMHQQNVHRKIWHQYPELKEKKTIVYAPTFRKESRYNDEALEQLVQAVDLQRYNLVIKAHPLMEPRTDIQQAGVLWDQQFSTIEMFTAADYVIVDYSAVIYEAALMRKPLFFYTYDMKQYSDNRDFYIDYNEEMPGMISADASQIMEAIAAEQYDLSRVTTFADRFVAIQKNCTQDLAKKILAAKKQ